MSHALSCLVDSPDFSLKHRTAIPKIPSEGKSPCVILLHGLGSDENDLLDFGTRLDPRLVVVSARAPRTVGPGQYAWFKVRFTPAGPVFDAKEAERSRETLIKFIAEVAENYDTDPRRTWVVGFSQGGIMSACVGLTAPESVAGFGMLSGRIPTEITPIMATPDRLAKISAFVSHGRQDPRLPIEYGRAAKKLIEENGLPLTYGEYEDGHRISEAMERDFQAWISERIDE